MKKLALVMIGALTVAILGLLFLYHLATRQPQKDQHIEVNFTMSCIQCHTAVTPEIVGSWKESKHGEYHKGCEMCHGTDKSDFSKKGHTRCERCHQDAQLFISRTSARSCFDCHDGHSLRFHD